MKSSKCRKVKVNITTYKEDTSQELNMNEDKKRNKTNPNKFICSICLNSKQDQSNGNNKRTPKSCPICQLTCDICIEKALNKTDKSDEVHVKDTIDGDQKNTESKSVQTIQTDLNKSMNLLNEVLTVFQSKKTEQVKSKSVVLKDASVSTSDVRTRTKLSFSKVFQFSIDQNRTNEDGKFVVMSSKVEYQRSNLDLLKNKSSSIPQMKLEQLKYSLKDKTKSKDVVEEVNRMFATVNKTYKNDNLNRPSIRSGPRILPVVVETTLDGERYLKENIKTTKNYSCKCCQTNMSSGDSIKCCHANESKTECCHQKMEKCDKAQCCHRREERCDKCVYMLCCHYKNSRKTEAGMMICQRCRNGKDPFIRSDHSFDDSG